MFLETLADLTCFLKSKPRLDSWKNKLNLTLPVPHVLVYEWPLYIICWRAWTISRDRKQGGRFGVGFYKKYDGGVDLSPIADLMKSEVFVSGHFKFQNLLLNAMKRRTKTHKRHRPQSSCQWRRT
jgi:NAD+ synthase